MLRKLSFSNFNIDTAIIPGGCTSKIQVPGVVWNKPFKQKVTELYDDWLQSNLLNNPRWVIHLKISQKVMLKTPFRKI